MQTLRTHPSLTSLNLGWNGIGSRGAAALAVWLSDAVHCRLRSLFLNDNELGVGDTGVAAAVVKAEVDVDDDVQVIESQSQTPSAGGRRRGDAGAAHSCALATALATNRR